MIKAYHKFAKFCYKMNSYIAVGTIAVMLVLMLTEVFRRYFLGKTFIWSDETIRLLLIFCAYFGGSAAYYKHSLVSFDLITSKLGQKANDILLLFVNVVLTVFFAFLLYNTFSKMTSPSVVKNISTATHLPGSVPYYGIFVGLIFLLLFTIDFYPDLIKHVFRGHDEEKEEN